MLASFPGSPPPLLEIKIRVNKIARIKVNVEGESLGTRLPFCPNNYILNIS